MDITELTQLLTNLQKGNASLEGTIEVLKNYPAENVSEGCIDHQRELRTGIPEVIYGESKSPEQVIEIAQAIFDKGGPVLATRVDKEKANLIQKAIPALQYHPKAQILTALARSCQPEKYRGKVLVVTAGTSDIPVAEEAFLILQTLGCPVEKIFDVGVAGLHRLMSHQKQLQQASVIIVVAGMEGALASVVSGLTASPVIGVPTSIGYGANFGGLSALLAMLNSCAPGLSVVNIDNGFGAASMALAINKALPGADII